MKRRRSLAQFRRDVRVAPTWALLKGRIILWREFHDIRENRLGWVNDDRWILEKRMFMLARKARAIEDELRIRDVPWRKGMMFRDDPIINDTGLQEYKPWV